MVYHRYSFADLTITQWLPLLQKLLKERSVPNDLCWLANDGAPILGLSPKMTWAVYPNTKEVCNDNTLSSETILNKVAPYNTDQSNDPSYTIIVDVITSQRQPASVAAENASIEHASNLPMPKLTTTKATCTYDEWVSTLIDYSNNQNQSLESTAIKDQRGIGNNESISVYQQGFMGFIGYDIAARHLSLSAKRLPTHLPKMAEQLCAFMGHYDIYLAPTSTEGQTTKGNDSNKGTMEDKVDAEQYQALWELHYQPDSDMATVILTHDMLLELQYQIASTKQARLSTQASLLLTPCWMVSDYQRAFEKTQAYLYRGDSYQINLTQKWQGCLPHAMDDDTAIDTTEHTKPHVYQTLLDYLAPLDNSTHAPFAGYLGVNVHMTERLEPEIVATSNHSSFETITNFENIENFKNITNIDDFNTVSESANFELLSCSPELFIRFDKDKNGNAAMITKPIKGTRPRGKTPQSDAQLKAALMASEKDRAENVMIVDLLRNDLGKYAQTGSVHVPKLFAIETFSNVHHMVSTVTATIKHDVHPLTVLFDSLPAGSITGTPKKRAVEIISELEVDARGAYCGTMGYMNFDGTGQWNVLIRTLQAQAQQVSLWAGGGITVGSECASEYQECFDKVGNLLAVLEGR